MNYNKRNYANKTIVVSIVITLFFSLLTIYICRLQVVNSASYLNEANINTIKRRKIIAARGDIIDRNGVVLASTKYSKDLYIIPHYFKGNINIICSKANINCDSLTSSLNKYPLNRILIAQDIGDDEAEYFQSISGLFVSYRAVRVYNVDSATSHIVGYTGRINRNILELYNDDSMYADDDYTGQSGIEYIYDHEIHGINGFEQFAVMANGLELLNPNNFLSKEQSITKSANGNNILLSIDDRIQLNIANDIGYRNGAAVMIDVNTGSVLAMYSSPNFDQKNIKTVFNNKKYPLLNRAIRPYAPGSTFKLVTALAGLETGIINPDTKFTCPGFYYFGGRMFHCWKHSGHGRIGLREAIQHSCDVYFYQLGVKVGLSIIIKYAKMLGFSEYSGIDIDNENKGSLVGRFKYKGAVVNTVIGQGEVTVTPLQLANAYATIANGGKLNIPRVVAYGEPIISKRNSFNKKNITILLDALSSVVKEEGGTAYYSRINGQDVGCKTGTAQVAGLDKNKKDNAIIVCLYPSKNPRIVISVFIEGGGHGSTISPIAFKAIQYYSELYDTNASIYN